MECCDCMPQDTLAALTHWVIMFSMCSRLSFRGHCVSSWSLFWGTCRWLERCRSSSCRSLWVPAPGGRHNIDVPERNLSKKMLFTSFIFLKWVKAGIRAGQSEICGHQLDVTHRVGLWSWDLVVPKSLSFCSWLSPSSASDTPSRSRRRSEMSKENVPWHKKDPFSLVARTAKF